MSTSIFKKARLDLKGVIESNPDLAGIPVFVERDDTPDSNGVIDPDKLDKDIELAINTKGLCIVVMSLSAGATDRVLGGAAVLKVAVPVAILENVPVNMSGDAGLKKDSELVLESLIKGSLGKMCGSGQIALNPNAFARGEDTPGLLEHYIAFEVLVAMRAGG